MTQELMGERDRGWVPNAGTLPTRVLLATDGSEDAAAATRAAVDICRRSGSKLHAVHVARRLPTYSVFMAHATDDFLVREAQEALERHLEDAEGHAARVHPRVGHPVEEILATGEEIGADLIVVGNRRIGPLKRALTGSVVEEVACRATCPVLVLRGGSDTWPPARVVIGDSSGSSGKAARMAVGLGEMYGADALLVQASPLATTRRKVPETGRAGRERRRIGGAAPVDLAVEAEANLGRRPGTRAAVGDVVDSLPDAADESKKPTLVAADGRGPGLLARFGIGSDLTKVLRTGDDPLLIHAQKPNSNA